VLTLVIGDGGLGKSRLSNDLTARLTTGCEWPDGGAIREPASAIILSAEDSPSYTIKPAIEAAGDVARVAILDAVLDESGTERTFQLGTDLAALDALIETTHAILIVIDPVSAYFGTRLDSYRDTDVRAVLEPVCKLAERRRVAILGIMHIGKAVDRTARHRALGSVAFVNAARLVFAIPIPTIPTAGCSSR
jgi:RecA-family ATPase